MIRKPTTVPFKMLDVELGIDPPALKYLLHDQWKDAKESCAQRKHLLLESGYEADGIQIVAGDSWFEPFVEP